MKMQNPMILESQIDNFSQRLTTAQKKIAMQTPDEAEAMAKGQLIAILDLVKEMITQLSDMGDRLTTAVQKMAAAAHSEAADRADSRFGQLQTPHHKTCIYIQTWRARL